MRDQGTLLRGVIVAEHEDRSVIEGPSARTVIDEIAQLARHLGCEAVTGASSSGERLIGALLLAHSGEFHVWAPGSSDRVLVVEGVAVGDAAVCRRLDEVQRTSAAAFGVMLSPSESVPVVQRIDIHVVATADR